jgi:PKD domain-containing protein/invasin-like protein
MRRDWFGRDARGRAPAGLALGVLLALGGCGLDEVQIPDLEGPSELGLSITLTADPDIVVADGFSTSVIRATVRDQNGKPVTSRDIFFAISDESGTFADIGILRSSNGPGTGATVRTDGQGVAQVIYESPVRTDFTAQSSVLVSARAVGSDFNGQIYRTVRIELRSAEPRLFPPRAGNAPPTCGFVVEATSGSCQGVPQVCTVRANSTVLFQTTSSDSDGTIVRYQWFFGDGTVSYAPDTNHVFRTPDTYTVTHLVTDNNGGQAACGTTLIAE